jgi:UDP-N-acetylglucosamine:LPS N-acetylglucosamine transferase
MVLVTTGGIPQNYGFLDKLNKLPQVTFVMPGAGPKIKMVDNLIILPHRSDFYHPDLVNAADAVVGKVGYSTLSEIYHGGVPFGYVARSDFRESESMVQFIQEQIPGIPLSESEFNNGNWTTKLADLLDLARVKHNVANGAEQIGRFIEKKFL